LSSIIEDQKIKSYLLQKIQEKNLEIHNFKAFKRFKRQHFKPFLDNSFLVDIRHDEMMFDRPPASLRLIESSNQTSETNKLKINKLSSEVEQTTKSTLNKIKNKITRLYDKIKNSFKQLTS
jgi:hypothetical protein